MSFGRSIRFMVTQGQMSSRRQEMRLSACRWRRRLTRFQSVPTAIDDPVGSSSQRRMMYSVLPSSSAASTTGRGHSGCTITRTPGSAARASSIWRTVNAVWTLQKPFQRMTRDAARSASARPPRAAMRGFQTSGSSAAIPSRQAVLRPRCSSGKKNTASPSDSAQRNAFSALPEVQTAPPCSPTNAFRSAPEFM